MVLSLNQLLIDLVRSDQSIRWERGERPLVEQYLDQYGALRDDVPGILDLITSEIGLREARGERPQGDEYVRRFPQLERQLRIQFEVHELMTPAAAEREASALQPPTIPGY